MSNIKVNFRALIPKLSGNNLHDLLPHLSKNVLFLLQIVGDHAEPFRYTRHTAHTQHLCRYISFFRSHQLRGRCYS